MAIQFSENDFTITSDGNYFLHILDDVVGDVEINIAGADTKDKKFYIERILNKNGDTRLNVFDSNNADIIVTGSADGNISRNGGYGDTLSRSDANRSITVLNISEGNAVMAGNGNGNVYLSETDKQQEEMSEGKRLKRNIAVKMGTGRGSATNNSINGLSFREDLGIGDSVFKGVRGIAYHGPFDEDLFSDLLSCLKKPLGKIGIDIPFKIKNENFMHTLYEYKAENIIKLANMNEKMCNNKKLKNIPI